MIVLLIVLNFNFFNLLALFVGHRLCIHFFVSKANFLTTLRSHLDVTRKEGAQNPKKVWS